MDLSTVSRDFSCSMEDRDPEEWFEDVFGFREGEYEETRSKFVSAKSVLMCTETQKIFNCGIFETPSLLELRERFTQGTLVAVGNYWAQDRLTFCNIVGDTRELHCDSGNDGAVFQVSSLFNCLETGFGYSPDDGITRYIADESQGAAAAMACPAATVFRNYFVDGTGQGRKGKQVDCLAKVAELVGNAEKHYWTMRNGYCLPKVKGGIRRLSKLVANDSELRDSLRSNVQVGVQWDTDVWSTQHTVCQLFCSALPVGLEKTILVSDWLPFAKVVLEAVFDATLTFAALLATKRGERVKVYLTTVGSGLFGNRRGWIAEAIERALRIHEKRPLDVMLVHPAELPRDNEYQRLELGREPAAIPALPSLLRSKGVTEHLFDLGLTKPPMSLREQMWEVFKSADMNRDGVLDQGEFTRFLQNIDGDFFTTHVVGLLLADADALGDGVVHYAEFVGWLCGEDHEIRNLVLWRCPTPEDD